MRSDALPLAIPGIFITVFFIVPLIYLIAISFTAGFPLEGVASLETYIKIFSRYFYFGYMANTMYFAVIVTILCLLFGYPIAYFMVRYAERSYNIILLAVVAPLLVGVVVRTVGWVILLGAEGLVNDVLWGAGLIEQPLRLLYTPGAAVVGMVHVLLPFMILSIASVLSRLDYTLEEAAQSLGAGAARTFWRVTLPLSLPGVMVGCVITFCLTIGAYVTPVLLGGGKAKLLSPMIYDELTSAIDWSLGSALSIVLLIAALAALALVPAVAWLTRRG
ncbi:ABC transporter permease [Bosea sp. (in: a-proteobacteria)]|uniref:ABC transporter permease n=1 Tax=Bosea sp. (in: a-proteobacteria) TaxID=1871050 RepID=UPI0026159C0F|nr:ABC transporter permease [Bosea sp. (in: a-proteobacteria)]MCO5089831.1 ABC transporter permease [Bosea sp. (in: a-proteobacteria)]